MARLEITLHFEGGDPRAVGGGWAWYQPADQLVTLHAIPAFIEPLECDTATDRLLQDWLDHVGHQLAF